MPPSKKKVKVKKTKTKLNAKTKKVTKPKRAVLHGRGGYFGDLGSKIGGTAGNVVDGVVSIGKALGFGDYKVRSNTLAENGGPPAVVNSKHSNIIRHREYLGDVRGYQNFTVTKYPINPGQSVTFPWLAPIAAAYEQYRIRGMLFEFLSTASSTVATTNVAQGTVILATEYNSNLPTFATKMQMENHEYSTTTKPAVSAIHPIECARGLTPTTMLYVRTSSSGTTAAGMPATSTYNPLSYDLGQFQIATVGLQADDVVIGELWCTYEVEFYKPTMVSTTTANVFQHLYWDSALGSKPDGTYPVANLRNKFTHQIATSSTAIGMSGIAPGHWIICIQLGEVPLGQSWTIPFPTFVGATDLNMFRTNSGGSSIDSNSIAPTTAATVNNASDFIYLLAVSADQQWAFQFSGVTLPAGYTTYDFFLIPFGTALTTNDSRKAVDWDPITLLNRKLDELLSYSGPNFNPPLTTNPISRHESYDHITSLTPSTTPQGSDLVQALRNIVSKTPTSTRF